MTNGQKARWGQGWRVIGWRDWRLKITDGKLAVAAGREGAYLGLCPREAGGETGKMDGRGEWLFRVAAHGVHEGADGGFRVMVKAGDSGRGGLGDGRRGGLAGAARRR